MILVDTSVWIDHFRTGSGILSDALEREEVMTHPLVIGELACWNLARRREVLGLLSALPGAVVATHDEVIVLIERRRLMGRGIGYIDAHLLAAVSLTGGLKLWTHDKSLAAIASDFGVAYEHA